MFKKSKNKESKQSKKESKKDLKKASKKESKKESKSKKKAKNNKNAKQEYVLNDTFLEAIAPLGNVIFYSDHFRTGLYYGVILTFQADQGTIKNLRPMWGTDLLPVISDGVSENALNVTSRLVISMQNRPDKWVRNKIKASSSVADGTLENASESNDSLDISKGSKMKMDHRIISDEYVEGASYLDATYKIILYAYSKSDLDIAIRLLQNHYKGIFTTVRLTRYIGQQQQEYEQLLGPAIDKIGRHDNFTSTEWAGAYPFYSDGWRDPAGDYVGYSQGDIHFTPVLWDSTDYKRLTMVGSGDKRHVVSDSFNSGYGDEYAATAWSFFITQSELMTGANVYEISLNDEDVTDIRISADINEATLLLDMSSEVDSINMFQAFGTVENELKLFSVLLNKIALMFLQLNPNLNATKVNYLKSLLKQFYINNGLWSANPEQNRQDLRLVQIRDYSQIPVLSQFVVYLKQVYDLLSKGRPGHPPDRLGAETVAELLTTAEELINSYGFLFNKTTTLNLDKFQAYPRKVFSFGSLSQSGNDIVMVQFLNTFSFISNFMQPGDTLHITGAELITDSIWEYLEGRFSAMWSKNMKVTLGFNNVTSMVTNRLFERADTVLTGLMTPTEIDIYKDRIKKEIPYSVTNKMSGDDDRIFYLRKGTRNIVFTWDASFL